MILLSDAIVLMDMGHVDGLDALAQIAPVEVLDITLQDCDHHSHPALIDRIGKVNIKEVAAPENLLFVAKQYCAVHDRLSMQDALCLHYAKQAGRSLLTNEKQLQAKCSGEGIQAHGTIWVMEQVFGKRLRQPAELCRWLSILSTKERRIPKSEVARLATMFGCKAS